MLARPCQLNVWVNCMLDASVEPARPPACRRRPGSLGGRCEHVPGVLQQRGDDHMPCVATACAHNGCGLVCLLVCLPAWVWAVWAYLPH